MNTNPWIQLSLHFYRQLLHLYPQVYRATYEMEMLRVFKNQCQEAYQQHGSFGLFLLWSRTLVDLSVTVIYEHLSDPRATVGLLDVMPNTQLPWKGVLLVLIPGLIFFVSQVVQVTSTRDWFFLILYRAGYFLILPVLFVWLITRRFPVWGLIPFGLLYATVWNYIDRFNLGALPFIGYRVVYARVLFGIRISVSDTKYLLAVFACVLLLAVLIRHNARRGQISRSAWKWLGLYGLLVVLQIMGEAYRRAIAYRFLLELSQESPAGSVLLNDNFFGSLGNFYDALPFLLLIFIGMLFARKYKGFSFLVLLGYLLPTVIYGRYGTWYEFVPFYVVGVAVVLYRFVVALVAPIWLVRTASVPSRQRAAAIPIAVAILCHVSLSILVYLGGLNQEGLPATLLDFAAYIWEQLIIAVGLGLALALYLPREKGHVVASATLMPTTTNF